jgi:hypothetical protein
MIITGSKNISKVVISPASFLILSQKVEVELKNMKSNKSCGYEWH